MKSVKSKSWIEKNVHKYTVQELAEICNISSGGMFSNLNRWGLVGKIKKAQKGRPHKDRHNTIENTNEWTEEELKYLQEYYPIMSITQLMPILKKRREIIRLKALELGLKKERVQKSYSLSISLSRNDNEWIGQYPPNKKSAVIRLAIECLRANDSDYFTTKLNILKRAGGKK